MNFVDGAEAQKFGAYTIGIRPEHIDAIDHRRHLEGNGWRCRTSRLRHLLPYPHGKGWNLTIRTAGESAFRHGDTVYVTPDDRRMHKFNAQGLVQ